MSDVASDTTIVVSTADVPTPSGKLWWAMWACLGIGIALSAGLVWQGRQAAADRKARAAEGLDGCPTGEECAEVLSSPYSRILGISLTKWNLGFYLVVGFALLATTKSWQLSLAPPLSLMLPVITFVGVTAALWSMAVMLFVLDQLCLICTCVHAINTLLFVLSVWYVRQDWYCRQLQRWKGAVPPLPTTPIKLHIALGLLFAISQLGIMTWFHGDTETRVSQPEFVITPSVLGVHEIPAHLLALLPLDAKTATATDDAADGSTYGGTDAGTILWTSKGPRDAPHRLVVFSCPTCPKCAQLHSVLRSISEANPQQLRIDLRFYPLWHTCNDAIREGAVGNRHRDACPIVRCALAVARAAPEKFAAYQDWLSDQGGEIDAAEALAEAEKRAGKAAISKALNSDELWARLRADIALAVRLDFRSVPQIYLAQGQVFGGVTADNLQQLLVAELGLAPVALDHSPAPRIWVADHYLQAQGQMAIALTREKSYARAVTAYRKALEIKPDWIEMSAQLAWLLATCPDDKVRNGQQALEQAELTMRTFKEQTQGKQLTKPDRQQQGKIYDALAAAQAELEDYDAAQDLAKLAIDRFHECGNKEEAEHAHERFELYQKREPYRE